MNDFKVLKDVDEFISFCKEQFKKGENTVGAMCAAHIENYVINDEVASIINDFVGFGLVIKDTSYIKVYVINNTFIQTVDNEFHGKVGFIMDGKKYVKDLPQVELIKLLHKLVGKIEYYLNE